GARTTAVGSGDRGRSEAGGVAARRALRLSLRPPQRLPARPRPAAGRSRRRQPHGLRPGEAVLHRPRRDRGGALDLGRGPGPVGRLFPRPQGQGGLRHAAQRGADRGREPRRPDPRPAGAAGRQPDHQRPDPDPIRGPTRSAGGRGDRHRRPLEPQPGRDRDRRPPRLRFAQHLVRGPRGEPLPALRVGRDAGGGRLL
ncbi:MAG: hypothetical protein AVDCRST_MAG73-1994, partial [uncultured Thermomicrobiales bacterium]